jgi:predicted nucleotidyltransferase
MDATSIEALLKAFFEDGPRGALAVYLYGSVARGQARPDSDVDIGVLFAADPPATLEAPQFAIEAALERLLGSPVQVVGLNRAPADLVHRILRDGRLVLDRDRAARIRFEVRSRNEYFDMAPIRRLYRRYPAPATNSAGRVAEPRR